MKFTHGKVLSLFKAKKGTKLDYLLGIRKILATQEEMQREDEGVDKPSTSSLLKNVHDPKKLIV